MADQKSHPPGGIAGWVVAAMVAVVAVCAVSFMITQRPREALAVAGGDPMHEAPPRAALMAPTTPSDAAPARGANPPDGADTGRIAPEPFVAPRTAMDANAAASNASALEPAH